MKRITLSFAALLLFGLPVTTWADNLTFQAPATAPNSGAGGAQQFDLDHHSAYTWRIDNVDLHGASITGATLTFRNISNWDTNPNMLFIHLLDSAKYAGVQSFLDATGTPVSIAQIQDNFANPLYASNPLVNSGTANTLLTSQSFTTTPTTFVYTFSASQLNALTLYLQNGNNIAFGLDPDCHFWNNGIVFNITTGQGPHPVPEPATLTLLGAGFAGLVLKRRRRTS